MTTTDNVASVPPTTLPLAEAASRLGLSVVALRSRIRRGSITARRGNTGQWLVEVPAHAAAQAGKVVGMEQHLSLDELQVEIDALRQELSEAKAQRDAAATIATTKVEAAERIIEDLRTALDRETVRADRYEAELAHLRRPLWERLIEALRRRS
jgi:hypothetical protein